MLAYLLAIYCDIVDCSMNGIICILVVDSAHFSCHRDRSLKDGCCFVLIY